MTVPKWLAYTLVTMALWGGWGVLSKPLSGALSSWQVQSFSNLGLLPVLMGLAISPRVRRADNARRGFWLALSAGVITSLGNVACYEALGAGGKAAAVIPLTSLYPLVTVILALFLLREALNAIQWTGAGISLAALYCFNGAPGAAGLSPWLVIALAPIVLWGVAALLQKISTQHASSELATFAFLLGFLPVGIATPLAHPMEWNLRAGTWALLLLLGLFFALGNLTLMAAYASGGRAAVVTTMASLYSVVTIPLAVLALGESITAREGLGLALALAAVAALSWEGRASAPKVCLDQSDSSL